MNKNWEKDGTGQVDVEKILAHPFEEFFKLTACGKFAYLKRTFTSGESVYTSFWIDDPGENESFISPQAYNAVRFPETHRQTHRP
jgi:hypothetical protein